MLVVLHISINPILIFKLITAIALLAVLAIHQKAILLQVAVLSILIITQPELLPMSYLDTIMRQAQVVQSIVNIRQPQSQVPHLYITQLNMVAQLWFMAQM